MQQEPNGAVAEHAKTVRDPQSDREFARSPAQSGRRKSKTRDGQSVPLDGLSPVTAALGTEVDAIVGWFGRANMSQQTFSLGARWDFRNGFAQGAARSHRHGRGFAPDLHGQDAAAETGRQLREAVKQVARKRPGDCLCRQERRDAPVWAVLRID